MSQDEGGTKKRFLRRVYNKIYTVTVSRIKERSFSFNGDEKLKYLLLTRKKSRILIVGFQAYNAQGAFYNYVSTLNKVNASKLYIKDDFAENRLGDYYLGHKGTFSVEKAVYDLINRTAKQLNAQRIIFIGSSKGGYAALNFGVRYPNAAFVIASPQYYLGRYLRLPKKYQPILRDILEGEITEDKISGLDHHLADKLKRDSYGASQSLYIMYSVHEDVYEEHIRGLLEDAKAAGISVHEHRAAYEKHWQLKYYFPDYLCQTVMKITEE